MLICQTSNWFHIFLWAIGKFFWSHFTSRNFQIPGQSSNFSSEFWQADASRANSFFITLSQCQLLFAVIACSWIWWPRRLFIELNRLERDGMERMIFRSKTFRLGEDIFHSILRSDWRQPCRTLQILFLSFISWRFYQRQQLLRNCHLLLHKNDHPHYLCWRIDVWTLGLTNILQF